MLYIAFYLHMGVYESLAFNILLICFYIFSDMLIVEHAVESVEHDASVDI